MADHENRRPPAQVGVGVKALEWTIDGARRTAPTPFGTYTISRTEDGHQLAFEYAELAHIGYNSGPDHAGAVNNLIATAQADYEARIRSALAGAEPEPVYPPIADVSVRPFTNPDYVRLMVEPKHGETAVYRLSVGAADVLFHELAGLTEYAPIASPAQGDAEARDIIEAFLRCPEVADCAPEDLDQETRELEKRARRFLQGRPTQGDAGARSTDPKDGEE